ncbi:hypothetical protein V6N12_024314 [Hibiscus sabdariffa]|uniref:Uncharacterized protein n=1 Tax=Hibiscus sabdariffa TaxID=183260 RepID=A0ABR2G0A6_9ROSI
MALWRLVMLKSHCDHVVKGVNCDASAISVPLVTHVVSSSIAIDSALKGKEQVHVASSVIDSAVKGKTQGHVPSPIASCCALSLPPKCSHCSVFGHSKKTCFASEGEGHVIKAVTGNEGKRAVYVQKSHCDHVVKGVNCDASAISVPLVTHVVSSSIAIDSALKGKEQVHVASSVIDSAVKGKTQGHVPSPIASCCALSVLLN